jgi:hypothetical protein
VFLLRLSIILFFAFIITNHQAKATTCTPLDESFYIHCKQGTCNGVIHQFEKLSSFSECARHLHYSRFISPEVNDFFTSVIHLEQGKDASGYFRISHNYRAYTLSDYKPATSAQILQENLNQLIGAYREEHMQAQQIQATEWLQHFHSGKTRWLNFSTLPKTTTEAQLVQETRKQVLTSRLDYLWVLSLILVVIFTTKRGRRLIRVAIKAVQKPHNPKH